MRPIALLSLFFGFIIQGLLDGQPFTNALLGTLCGTAALVCGLKSAQRDKKDALCRWEGWIMGGLGIALVIFCATQLTPSAYRLSEAV
jgi:hypothetical protein